jgi:hypothetical protein
MLMAFQRQSRPDRSGRLDSWAGAAPVQGQCVAAAMQNSIGIESSVLTREN